MFSSPSPTQKHLPTSTNELNRYLPDLQRSQQQKQQALYTKFSTLEQIAKSIEIERDNFDAQIHTFNNRINQCTNGITRARKECSSLKDKIDGIRFGNEFGGDLELAKIPLETINYTLNQKPRTSTNAKKEQIQIFLSQIENLEKECAQLYCNENEKFEAFSNSLFAEFDKVSSKVRKSKNRRSQEAVLQLKIMKDEGNFKTKIKKWEKQLNERFQERVLKLIEKVQSSQK